VRQVEQPFSDDHVRMLKERGHTLGELAARQSDQALLVEVDHVFMFEGDAVDVAEGRATVEQVKMRNRGKVFPLAPHD